jgi:hypothetical protein
LKLVKNLVGSWQSHALAVVFVLVDLWKVKMSGKLGRFGGGRTHDQAIVGIEFEVAGITAVLLGVRRSLVHFQLKR